MTQSAGIGFPYPDVTASDVSLAMDVNASSSAQLHVATPFDRQMVRISKAEHIKLKCDAHYWQTQFSRLSSHRERDVQRLKDAMAQRDRDGDEALSRLRDQIAQHDTHAVQVLSELQAALDKSQAHIKDLQKRLFGRKSEKPGSGNEQQTGQAAAKRARGQQPGQPGHGRTLDNGVLASVCCRTRCTAGSVPLSAMGYVAAASGPFWRPDARHDLCKNDAA